MRVATLKINHVVKRLDLLSDWLARTQPGVVALREAWLARGQAPAPVATALPGDRRDRESRYVEAAIQGVLFCCLYLPNGNYSPAPSLTTSRAGSSGGVRALPH